MSELYRVHLFKDRYQVDRDKYINYCLKNNIVSINFTNKESYKDINDYLYHAENILFKNNKSFKSVKNSITNMKKGDLCWVNFNNKYYLGEIQDNEVNYKYNPDLPYMSLFRECKWFSKQFNQDEVSGDIIRSFVHRGQTIQKIKSETALKYSEYLYNKSNLNIPLVNLLHPDDLEDILSLYLQIEKGYIIYPSTCKKSTAVYEYMLINKYTYKKAVVQCKTGSVEINENFSIINDFKDFDVYITTISGKYPTKLPDNVKIITIDKLLSFALKNENILTDRVKNFIKISKS